MHEKWGSVFGAISFFSQLKFLIAFLDGCAGQPWASLMPEFIKVAVCIFAYGSNYTLLVPSFISIVGNLLKQAGSDCNTHHLLRVAGKLDVSPPVPQQDRSPTGEPRSEEQAAKSGMGDHQQ